MGSATNVPSLRTVRKRGKASPSTTAPGASRDSERSGEPEGLLEEEREEEEDSKELLEAGESEELMADEEEEDEDDDDGEERELLSDEEEWNRQHVVESPQTLP